MNDEKKESIETPQTAKVRPKRGIEKITAPDELFRRAYYTGQFISDAYGIPQLYGEIASNNRAMELAFLAGLLNQPCEIDAFKEEALR